MADGKVAAKTSDLKARTLTALVMVAVAGSALWLGGWLWIAFVAAVSLGVLWEWRGLVVGFVASPLGRALWNVGGIAYIGLAGITLALLRTSLASLATVLALLLAVIATDIGAYFAGRAIGGPKIAPRISPSKTWAGLGGGILGAGLVIFAWLVFGQYMLLRSIDLLIVPADRPDMWQNIEWLRALRGAVPGGIAVAVVAQAGDFFESWMKRRAGVKDSGRLLPGHGGLFDRVDGLLAVLFALSVLVLAFGLYDYLRVA